MADSKITALTALTAADPANDMIPIVDVSDTPPASGNTKRISINNILAASGTATLASATITGDLTVATDRLKVVTGSTAVQIGATTQTQFGTTAWPTSYIAKSGSRVLIGSAGELILWNEAAAAIGNNSTLFVGAKSGPVATIIAGGAIKGGIENTSDYSGFLTLSTQRSDASMIERYRIDSTGIATWSNVGGVAGTAMTLNATGLGVGASPLTKFQISGGSGAVYQLLTDTTSGYHHAYIGKNGNNLVFGFSVNNGSFTADEKVRIDTSGNVGIGVTPSAWNTLTPVQVKNAAFSGYLNNAYVTSNSYYNANHKYIASDFAAMYVQTSGQHQWYTAPSGTAGNAITFTQAMTLNANGALALQGGNTSANGVGITFPATQVASTDANTLDDYEEGNWTPTVGDASSGGNQATTATAVGRYTKIGRLVTVQWEVTDINTTGLTAGNALYIRGLPFASSSATTQFGTPAVSGVTFSGYLTAGVFSGSSFPIYSSSSGGSLADIKVSALASGTADIWGTLTYIV